MHAKYFNSFCCYPLKPHKNTQQKCHPHTQRACALWTPEAVVNQQHFLFPRNPAQPLLIVLPSALVAPMPHILWASIHFQHTHTTPPPLELPQLNNTQTQAQRGQLQHVVYFSFRTVKRVLISLQMSMIVITSYLFWSNSAMWYTWKIN